MEKEVLLEVKDLDVTYGERKKKYKAVRKVNFKIYKGETFGLVGESGSGKTTIGRAIMRIVPSAGGEMLYKGEKINGKISPELDRMILKEIQMIFQDPQASLNERAKVDYIISEGLMNIEKGISEQELKKRVEQAILDVGLLPEFSSRFPHEFSGGQRQRIGIARALITYLFIAHDLSVMRFITDRIGVIHKGRIVEMGETQELITHAIHPYTRALLSAIPMPDPRHEKEKKLLVYDPEMHDYTQNPPEWKELRPGHFVLANEKEAEEWTAE